MLQQHRLEKDIVLDNETKNTKVRGSDQGVCLSSRTSLTTAELNQDLKELLDRLRQERENLVKLVDRLGLSGKNQLEGFGSGGGGKPKSQQELRDYYKQESENLQRMLRNRGSFSPTRGLPQSRSPTRQPPVKGGTYDSELMRVLRERDEMQAMLDKYERHLSEIQANVKVLTADRDKTSLHCQQAQDEIAQLRREVVKSKMFRSSKSSVAAQSILKRVESERDTAEANLHRMTNERDSLRERLKISQETAISERARLEQRVEDLQATVLALEQERGELKNRQITMRDAMMGLEEEVHRLDHKLTTAEDELNGSKAECAILRLSVSQTETVLSDNQRRLTTKIGELQKTQERNKQLDERNDSLLRQVSGLREEVSALQATVSELDQRRDVLQEELEMKSELLSTAHGQLDDKEKTIRNLKLTVDNLETSAGSLRESVIRRELETVQKKLVDTGQELSAVVNAKETALRENAHLRDDLDKIRLENQALQLKVDDSTQEIDDYKSKVENYITDISRVEDLLSSKERECRDLQESRRRASAQAESWQEQARQDSDAAKQTHLQLVTCHSERRHLMDKVESLEVSLQEALSAERRSNSQLSQLQRSVLQKEEELRQAQVNRTVTQTDLQKTQELCVKLDASKEAVLRELDSYRSEVELLRKQLASERLSVKRLETMVVSSHEKVLQHQLFSRERQPELQQLRDKLDRAAEQRRRQGLSSTLLPSSPPRHSHSPRTSWSPERTYHIPRDRTPERSVTFRDLYD